MKALIFFILLINVTYLRGQESMLKDSLIKEVRLSELTGDTIVWYKDYTTRDELPPSLIDKDGKSVEYIIQRVNSREKINEIVSEVFTEKEIEDMKGRSFYVQILASPTGAIRSASLYFLHGDPKVDVDKLVQFSNRLKERISLKVNYDKNSVKGGVVGWTYRVFPLQE